MAWFKKQLYDLNARLSTVQRQQKRVEDDPSEAIAGQDEPQYHPDLTAPSRYPVPRPVESTEHLARRFREG